MGRLLAGFGIFPGSFFRSGFDGGANGEFLRVGRFGSGSNTGPSCVLSPRSPGVAPAPGMGEYFLFIGSANPSNGSFDFLNLGLVPV